MRNNIDLTENRDFEDERVTHVNMLNSIKYVSRDKNLFHEMIGIDDSSLSIDGVENQLIITGDKEERLWKKKRMIYNLSATCARCGLEFSRKPYLKTDFGLCFSCDNLLEKEVSDPKKILFNR